MTNPIEVCPHCYVAADIVHERRGVLIGNRRVEIDDEFFRCMECGEEFYTPDLAERRQRLAVERARNEDNLLTPEQIRAIREGLGLSQSLFERILGVGKKTCVRWEQGRVSPNVATDRLMRLVAADRENVARLAGINAVVLPDSCFIPQAHADAPAYTGVLAAWEREELLHDIPRVALVTGKAESKTFDTAEHEAIIAGATDPVLPVKNSKAFGIYSNKTPQMLGTLQ